MMRKFLLSAIVLMMSASAGSNLANAQDVSQRQEVRERAIVVADSVKAKGARLGKAIAKGSVVTADSIGAKGARFGKKAKIVGDTIGQRSKRAWKVMKGEE